MSHPLSADTSLSPYRHVPKLGAGGTGDVWPTEDARLWRRVALKASFPSVAQEKDCRRRSEPVAFAEPPLTHLNCLTTDDVGSASRDTGSAVSR